jgi:hypothetical protein
MVGPRETEIEIGNAHHRVLSVLFLGETVFADGGC